MITTEIIQLGKEAGKAFNNVMDRLPTRDQMALKQYYNFKAKYLEEITREDADFDSLLKWREDIKLLEETVMNEIFNNSKS